MGNAILETTWVADANTRQWRLQLILTGQHHVGSNVQASSDAEPAILSVKSVLSVVKKHNRIFTTDITDNTDESQRSQKGCSVLEKMMFSCL
jgi:hypothetical protein